MSDAGHADAERLSAYLEGDLDGAARGRLEAHLHGCADCTRELRGLREMVSALRSMPEPAPPGGIADRVIARLRKTRARPTRGWRGAAALAAGLAALLLAGPWIGGAPAPERANARPGPLAEAARAPGARPAFFRGSSDLAAADALDAELAAVRDEPLAFLERMGALPAPARSSALAPLVARAAERGDAGALAERLRAQPHPLARELSAHFARRR